ncbi:MAG: hypothetical protein R3C45_10015 [Phycisphaerales bacterium]
MSNKSSRRLGNVMFGALVFVAPVTVQADSIPVAGYTYDFSQVDEIGGATTIHAFATDPSNARLTDGDTGSLTLVPFGIQNVAFPNGTWVGFVNHGSGNAYQPRVEFDLGGSFNVASVEVTYLVEDGASIFAPNPVMAIDPETSEEFILYNALSVATSTDGLAFTEAGFSNDFVLQADDAAAHSFEKRTAVIPLGGAAATHVSIEVHTPWSFIFLSEVVINEGAAALVGDLNGDGFVGIGDLNIVLGNWNQNVTPGSLPDGDPSGDGFVGITDLNTVLGNWNAGTPPVVSVPEPAAIALLTVGGLTMIRQRFV